MEHVEESISGLLLKWRLKGYTDTIIVDEGKLFAISRGEYFTLSAMKEDIRAEIYDDNLWGSAWSVHALTLDRFCKGILILGGEMYNPWELPKDIRLAFDMPHFSTDYLKAVC